ncbi:alginate lyase family protein [Labilibacter marinus]|uniref:alginate lyase family protein n=1 Tax=Labilibacter marinus TaxID=1477105 RepID=UPI0009F90A75|nr:alginate lyase family protein [Labilibacter marinus]
MIFKNIFKLPVILIASILLMLSACSTKNDGLIYVNQQRLEKVKDYISKNDTFYLNAYHYLIEEADNELEGIVNPVTNKTQLPPSGDKHDYMSIAPYRWPNPSTSDGFPWMLKDGQINPMYYGDDFDHARLSQMFDAIETLWMAYYFSEEERYAYKAKQIIKAWFLDDLTRVNPNVNYGQAIPGEVDGRRAGIIEWKRISVVVTAVQLLAKNEMLSNKEMEKMNDWFGSYYQWLKTNPMGIENDNGLQNHSTCYDYQMVGLARYLALNDEAKDRLEAAKIKRIATQIKPDGTQPRELGRTRSVHYASENLLFMSMVAELGMPLGVDLWNYSSADGRSIQKAFEFLRPFAEGNKDWPYKEIGGVYEIIDQELKPLFAIAGSIFNENLLNKDIELIHLLNYKQVLLYPVHQK